MVQTKEECLAFLNEAREALDELSLLMDREEQMKQDELRLERALEGEQKAVSDEIRQTVKVRRDEINASYDKEIDKAQERLKKVRSKREKAKSAGIKERIANETAALEDENRDMRVQLKTLTKRGHAPWYCRTKLYYSLFFPRHLKEYGTLLLYVLVCFLAVPCGIYLLIPERKPLYLAVVYLADVVLFGGSYIAVGNRTKLLYTETLREGRQILDQIYGNNRKIKVITSTIRKDRNESLYNLEKYDDEISQLQQELNEVAAQKKDALNTFENVTKTILADEIEHNHQDTMEQLRKEYDQVRDELKDAMQQVKTRRLYVTDHYGVHLGKEFLDPLKIAELCTIVQNGQAVNVSEAIAAHKRQHQQQA